ncbi:hypothetical protein [Glaciimonas soli]|uniref:Uncharacterized protein n=1 Tax=Glaciimonas soli TaxID=2590999 RepID=A0A843YRU9_9BURK|nr:hypothetical protein [Glaciimonas soli]MQR00228.1 hypothetical protein [Glaciimonas soli]
MDTKEKLTFRIDSYTPDTIPMARLAEYLSLLATLYGSEESVHFESVTKGSAKLNVSVDEPAVTKVMWRIQSVNSASAILEAQKAYQGIDDLLRADNAVGAISTGKKGGKLLDFPGRKLVIQEAVTIIQPTTVDGVIIKIGGKDATIPVHLRDQEGKVIRCEIRGEAYAKELSRHYLGNPLRAHGSGKWLRHADGTWEIQLLTIQSYEELDTTPLDEILTDFKNVADNGWGNLEFPIAEWRKLRGLE